MRRGPWILHHRGASVALFTAIGLAGGLAQPPIARAQDTWVATSMTGAPAPRRGLTGVWTGSRMIVWGGSYFNGTSHTYYDNGGVFDPVANAWSAMPTARMRTQHVAVWTGSKMIVWGGGSNVPELYDPQTNAWTQGSAVNAPADRSWATAVWTGSKMIVWGGAYANGTPADDGGVYDPVTNVWFPTNRIGTPLGRSQHSAVWTGTQMIVWGGSAGAYPLNDGGSYDPQSNYWSPTGNVGAPSARSSHSAVWTGSRMIVWGGQGSSAIYSNGAAYDPLARTWSPIGTTGAPSPRYSHAAVWTGSTMIVWGGWATGVLNTGGMYDPTGNIWLPTSTVGAPAARNFPAAAWTGTRLVIWGGNSPSSPGLALDTGGLYQPPLVPSAADLLVSKTDGQNAAIAGQPIAYTIVAANAGPLNAPGAVLTDHLPAAVTGATWACTASGGASCAAASGSGDVVQTVNLPVGGSVTFVVAGTVDAAATGTLANTVTVSVPAGFVDPVPANNAAIDTEPIVVGTDLSITKTDGQLTASPGQAITYLIAVTNKGPRGVRAGAVIVEDPLPAALLSPTWSCAAAGGAVCTASGTGDIQDFVTLPAGGTLTYTVSGTLSATPARLSNTASVRLPLDYGDLNPADDSATDTDVLECGTQSALVPDARVSQLSLAAGATRWLLFDAQPGRSYAVELRDALGTTDPGTATLFRGDDGCTGTSTASVRDVTAIEPAAAAGTRRLAFTASGSDTGYRLRLTNTSPSPLDYALSVSETTLYSASWTTNGSFNTYYSFQNTTDATIGVTLSLTKADGTSAGTTTLNVPAGATVATNTASLTSPRNAAGTARLSHDGPPGALIAEAAIANFGYTPAYVQPVRFRAVREGR